MPHPTRMSPAETALLVIDVQTKLLPKIPGSEALVRDLAFLIDGAKLVGVPVAATEQYPRGLGPTAPALAERLPPRPDKVAFSSCGSPGIVEGFRNQRRIKIVLGGIEAHVCITQTALDLLSLGFHVYIVADAVASRYEKDKEIALRRLEQAGAILVTCEMALFEWLGGSDHASFKAASALVQERMKALS